MHLAVNLAAWPWPVGWCWRNGVLSNLVASAVAFVAGATWAWRRHLRPHLERLHAAHAANAQAIADLHDHVRRHLPD